jgi:cell division protease FtsH
MAVMLGGRMAEQAVFGDITTGASNDLQKATRLARSMVMDYGMSAKLRNLVFGSHDESVFLGRDLGQPRAYSEDVARIIDGEVAAYIDEATTTAERVIADHRDKVDAIAKKLVKDEVIDKDDFVKLVGPRPHEVGKEAEDIAPGISNEPTDS